jgi:hypothetical protein
MKSYYALDLITDTKTTCLESPPFLCSHGPPCATLINPIPSHLQPPTILPTYPPPYPRTPEALTYPSSICLAMHARGPYPLTYPLKSL